MRFNFQLFFEQIRHSIFKASGTPARLSPKRIGFLLLFFPIFSTIKLFNSLGFLLDDLFYTDYKKITISEPVFILGNLRSGTTYLHRLLAKDHANFTTMRLWEIIFAHSVAQRKFFWQLKNIDDRLGGFFRNQLHQLEEQTWFNNPIHRMGLLKPHEDEGLLLSIWESINSSIFFPHLNLVEKYALFDKQVSPQNREKIMQFYKACLRRHLFARDGPKKFLSKNPAFSPKVDTLLESFPSSKIIYLVRDPLQVVPSLISWMSYQWGQYIDWPEKYIHHEFLIELAKEWYEYPLERLDQAPKFRYAIINFDELIANPKEVVCKIYDQFGFDLSREFSKILEREVEGQKKYKSKHKYSLKRMGLNKSLILEKFRYVYQRFQFDAH